ncbi:hypothetical protein D3C72_1977480 [compost metagenome]
MPENATEDEGQIQWPRNNQGIEVNQRHQDQQPGKQQYATQQHQTVFGAEVFRQH